MSDPVVDSNSDEDILEQVSQLMKCVAYGVKTEWNNSSDNGNTNIKNVYDYYPHEALPSLHPKAYYKGTPDPT